MQDIIVGEISALLRTLHEYLRYKGRGAVGHQCFGDHRFIIVAHFLCLIPQTFPETGCR
jgi:hypothetical protein